MYWLLTTSVVDAIVLSMNSETLIDDELWTTIECFTAVKGVVEFQTAVIISKAAKRVKQVDNHEDYFIINY